jgi:WD40 repeat protein
LLTGQPPFKADTPLATMKRVIEEEPRKPSALNPAVDRDLETVCLKCLEKDPQRRYASAESLADDVERWLRHEPIRARPSAPIERLGKWMRRNPRIAMLVVLLNVVLIIGLASILTVSVRLASANRSSRQANAQLTKTVRDFEWTKIDELISTGKRGYAIAYLSHFLRLNPNDQVAATRLVAMLSGCNFVLPASAPLRHGTAVSGLSLSADGQRVLTAAADGKVRLWDLRSSTQLKELAHPMNVLHASFVVDDRFVVTTCQDGTSRLWDLAEGKSVFQFPKAVPAEFSALSTRDGHRVILPESKTSMQIWDVLKKERAGNSLEMSANVMWRVFSPDDRHIALGAADGTVGVWNVDTSEPLFSPVKIGRVTRMAFSPDAKILAITWNGMITFLDPHTGARLREFQAHDNQVLWIEFTADSRRLVSMGWNLPLKIWNVASGQTLGQPMEAEQPFAYFHLSPDGKRLATYSQNGVARVWDAFTGLALSEPFEHEGSIIDLRFSSDGQFILTASQDGMVQLWDARAGQPKTFTAKTTDEYPCATFTLDPTRLIYTTERRAEILDVASGQRIAKTVNQAEQIYRLELSPNGKKFATAGWDFNGRVWDAQTGEPLTPPLPHRGRLYGLAFSPDGRLVATSSSDMTARLWNAETGEAVGPALLHDSEVMHVQFRPDSRALVTASLDTTARLWSTVTGEPLWPEPLRHKGIVWTAEFSPDGRRVVTASADRSAMVWDVESRRPLIRPMLHERSVYAAYFSPDGKSVLTCSEDGTARVWDSNSGEPISQPMRHEGKVARGQFSPDGRLVLTGSTDGVTRLWDARTGYALSEPLLHSGEIRCIQFSPDGRRCLSTAGSDALRLWDVVNAPAPAPTWFCDLVEAVAGKRLNSSRDVEVVSREAIRPFRERFARLEATDFYSRWAHWFLHERLKEPVPAFEPDVVNEAAQQ